MFSPFRKRVTTPCLHLFARLRWRMWATACWSWEMRLISRLLAWLLKWEADKHEWPSSTEETTPWAWDHTRPSISFDTFVLTKLGRGARNGLLQLPIAYFDLRSVCHRMNRCRPWKGKRSVSFNNGMWWESYLEYPWVALLFFRPAYPGCKRLIYIDLYWFIMFEVLHFTVGGVMRFYILAPVDPASPTQRVLIAFEAFWSIGIWLGTGCFTNVLAWHANVLSESCH